MIEEREKKSGTLIYNTIDATYKATNAAFEALNSIMYLIEEDNLHEHKNFKIADKALDEAFEAHEDLINIDNNFNNDDDIDTKRINIIKTSISAAYANYKALSAIDNILNIENIDFNKALESALKQTKKLK